MRMSHESWIMVPVVIEAGPSATAEELEKLVPLDQSSKPTLIPYKGLWFLELGSPKAYMDFVHNVDLGPDTSFVPMSRFVSLRNAPPLDLKEKEQTNEATGGLNWNKLDGASSVSILCGRRNWTDDEPGLELSEGLRVLGEEARAVEEVEARGDFFFAAILTGFLRDLFPRLQIRPGRPRLTRAAPVFLSLNFWPSQGQFKGKRETEPEFLHVRDGGGVEKVVRSAIEHLASAVVPHCGLSQRRHLRYLPLGKDYVLRLRPAERGMDVVLWTAGLLHRRVRPFLAFVQAWGELSGQRQAGTLALAFLQARRLLPPLRDLLEGDPELFVFKDDLSLARLALAGQSDSLDELATGFLAFAADASGTFDLLTARHNPGTGLAFASLAGRRTEDWDVEGLHRAARASAAILRDSTLPELARQLPSLHSPTPSLPKAPKVPKGKESEASVPKNKAKTQDDPEAIVSKKKTKTQENPEASVPKKKKKEKTRKTEAVKAEELVKKGEKTQGVNIADMLGPSREVESKVVGLPSPEVEVGVELGGGSPARPTPSVPSPEEPSLEWVLESGQSLRPGLPLPGETAALPEDAPTILPADPAEQVQALPEEKRRSPAPALPRVPEDEPCLERVAK